MLGDRKWKEGWGAVQKACRLWACFFDARICERGAV